MSLDEFMDMASNVIDGIQTSRAWLICKDGYSISVQAGYGGFYCYPNDNLPGHKYEAFDVAIEQPLDILDEYEYVSIHDELGYVAYQYVPRDTVELIIDMHGGVDDFEDATILSICVTCHMKEEK